VTADDGALVDARGVVRSFGGRRAVDGVDLCVRPGERVAVVGPNGAGKTTLLRMLATLLRPEAGTLMIAGAAIPKQSQAAREHIGYLGHDPMVYLDLTAQQNLELFCDLYGVPDARERIVAALGRVGLLARTHDPVRTFSRGMAQRLGIARLTLHAPRLLLLDEPYTGLDTQGTRILDELLGGLGGREAIVVVTHELDRALELAGEVVVMRRGRVAARVGTAGVGLDRFRTDYQELTA
jgi:heme exporter protein A